MGVTERPVTMFREHVGQESGAMTGLVTEELTCDVAVTAGREMPTMLAGIQQKWGEMDTLVRFS